MFRRSVLGASALGQAERFSYIGLPTTTEWVPGASPDEYDLLVYNEDFIINNIKSYGNIPGVFTITQQNATIKAEVDKLTTDKKALEAKAKSLGETIAAENSTQQKVDAAYEKTIWDMTEPLRKQRYPLTQDKYTKDKKSLFHIWKNTLL